MFLADYKDDKAVIVNCESNLILYSVSHQIIVWLQRRLGHAAVLSLGGITMAPLRSVRSSFLEAVGRISTIICLRMSAAMRVMAQVPLLIPL